MAKRKRRSTLEDEKDSGSELRQLAVSRKRNGDPIPVQAHVLAWLDHCLETGVAFKQTAQDYMRHITTRSFTWSQLDTKLRVIVKSHNRHPPYTPIILEKGTSCLQNFDGTQLQVRVVAIRSALPSQILGEIRHGPGFEVVLSPSLEKSSHIPKSLSQTKDSVTVPSRTSSRTAICLDSQSPPRSPRSTRSPISDYPTQPQEPGQSDSIRGAEAHFELDRNESNDTLALQRQLISSEAKGKGLLIWQRSRNDPDNSELSPPPIDVDSNQSVVPPVISTRLDFAVNEINRSLHNIHDALRSTDTRSEQHHNCIDERDELRRLVSQLEKKVIDIERAQLVNARIDQGILPPTDHDVKLDFHQLLSSIDQVCLSLDGNDLLQPLPSVWDSQSPLAPLIQRASAANHQSWMTLMCTQPPGKVETLRCLIATSVVMDVFEHCDLGLLGGSCFLLTKYREAVLLRDGAEALRRLDRSVHEMAREDLGLQSQLDTASKSMTTELEEILSPFYLHQSRQENECGQHTGTDAASTTRSMFHKIFSSALHLKMLLLQTGQKYRADFVPTGARFSPDTMSLVGFESMELWQQSQGFAGRATAAPASPRAVKFCVFPAIFAYPMETEWASESDTSAFTVDYCNFVKAAVPEEDLRLVSKAVVSVFE
ncbi:hypothetical protein PG988_007274 [Apiospora saccharicola]